MKTILTLSILILRLTVAAQEDFTIINHPYKGTKIGNYYETLSGFKISPILKSDGTGDPEKLIEGNLVLHFFETSVYVEDKIEKEVLAYKIEDITYSGNLMTISVKDHEYGESYLFDINLNDESQPISIEHLGRMFGVKYELPEYCLCK